MESQNIDVQKIVEEIKNEIKEKGLTSDILSFEDVVVSASASSNSNFSERAFVNELAYLNSHHTVLAYRPLKSNRKVIGGLIVFVKKVIRKLVKFYIEPVVSDQNQFNAHSVRAFNDIRKFIANSKKSEEQITELQMWFKKTAMPAVSRSESEAAELKAENGRLKAQVEELIRNQQKYDDMLESNALKLQILEAKLEKMEIRQEK